MREFSTPHARPISEDEAEALRNEVFAAARRMSNDQLLDLADALHDIIRARQAIRRTRGVEPVSFAPRAGS